MNKFFVVLILVSIFSSTVFSNENGRNNYKKANCQKCHNYGENFDAKKRQATNYHSLESWIHSCSTFFKIGWNAFEEDEVLEYLNTSHYNYKK